jgi:hypothetical protein
METTMFDATTFQFTKRTLAAAAMIAAVSAPSTAQARAIPAGGPGAAGEATGIASQIDYSQSQQGFQWGDAGIGAAGMLVLVGGAGASSLLARRRREHA